MAALNKEAQNVPTDHKRFREWADRECGAWPADVQIEAYRSWRSGDLEQFKRFYALMAG